MKSAKWELRGMPAELDEAKSSAKPNLLELCRDEGALTKSKLKVDGYSDNNTKNQNVIIYIWRTI